MCVDQVLCTEDLLVDVVDGRILRLCNVSPQEHIYGLHISKAPPPKKSNPDDLMSLDDDDNERMPVLYSLPHLPPNETVSICGESLRDFVQEPLQLSYRMDPLATPSTTPKTHPLFIQLH